ncbi:hypothetical protein COU37_04065 [Candidatus Micrarchaeota archaeon CG10_big_fil_rev_8_21_14_0_10_45_29]|nr:MAG: hypothetical protein COU37_04065 [Candidatus Micrarchaeota archaeon CG10_big_fil_rev_8_21_14_0_10_45_29]
MGNEKEERENQTEVTNTFAGGALVKLGSMGFVKVLGLVFTFIIINFFATAESDLFFQANAYVLGLVSIASLGLGISVVKFTPECMLRKKYEEAKTRIWTSIVASSLMSVIIIIAIIGAYYLLDYVALEIPAGAGGGIIDSALAEAAKASNYLHRLGLPLLAITGVVALFSVVGAYLGATLNAFKRFEIGAIGNVAFQILRLLFIGALIYFGAATANSMMGAYAATYFIILVFFAWAIWKKWNEIPGETKISVKILKKDIKFGMPIYASAMLESLITYMDVILVGAFLGEHPGIVTGYAAVIAFVRNIGPVIIGPITDVQLPMLVEEFEKKTPMFAKMTKEISRWSVYLGIPVLCVFLVYADALLGILAKDYVENAYLMWLFVPFVLATLISASFRNALIARGHVYTLLIASIIALTLNFGMDVALIPVIGVAGAAIASSVAAVFGEGYAVWAARAKFGAKLHYDILKGIAAGAVAVGAGYISLPYAGMLSAWATFGILQLVVGMGITCIVYSIALLLLKGLKRRDFALGLVFLEKRGFSRAVPFVNPFVELVCKYTG